MTSRLNKIKGLMVAANESLHEGSRETASNLMELALNEMQHVDPEDLEINLQVVDDADPDAPVVDYEPEEAADTVLHAGTGLSDMVRSLAAQARARG